MAETKRYGRQKLVWGLIQTGLEVFFLAVVALLVAHPFDAWLAERVGFESTWSRLAAFFTLMVIVQTSLSFPLVLHSELHLERKFALSRQSFGRWLWRYAKKHLLGLAFGLVLVEGLFLIIWLTGSFWWLVAAGASFVVSVLLGQLVPVLILPLFYKVQRLDDQELTARFTKLTAGTGLSLEGIYRLELSAETAKANAALAGLGRTRRVLLGDTLIDGFTPDEIEVVLAHEVGHHVYRHIPKWILLGLGYSTLSFFLCDRIVTAWAGQDFRAVVPAVYTLPMLILLLTLFSLLLGPLKNALSRHFERQCDRFALQRTGLRQAFRSAFLKLAKQNKTDPDPHPLEVLLLHDHPPIAQRLKVADGF